jgi:hypothetical protein
MIRLALPVIFLTNIADEVIVGLVDPVALYVAAYTCGRFACKVTV